MELYFGKVDEKNQIILEDDEFRHLKVVRKNVGESIQITDGNGNLFTGIIQEISKHSIIADIESKEVITPTTPNLHLAIAPTKNIDRIEWLVEKCVELGIAEFSFLLCRHSERKDIKTERLRRIAISAIKQSFKTKLPVINEMIPFRNFISLIKEEQKFICGMGARKEDHLKHLLKPKEDAIIMIGPEGDFNEDELNFAIENGYQLTGLGPERLRTETAALASCVYFNFNKHQ